MPRNEGKKNLPPTKPGPNGTTLYLADDGKYYPSSAETYRAKILELGNTDSIDNWHWEAGEGGAPQRLVRNRTTVPRNLESRRVSTLVKDHLAEALALMAMSQPLVHIIVPATATAPVMVYGKRNPLTAGTTGQDSSLFDGLWWHNAFRSANAAAATIDRNFGVAPPFHHLLDPNTGPVPIVLIIEDYVSSVITAGACEMFFGIVEHLTASTAATAVGIGFRAAADHVWHSFVNDCPGSVLPVTVRRNTTLAPLSNVSHRLTIIIDGRTKKITWLIDRQIVDSWVPGAPLDQMGASPGPAIRYALVVPALGNANLRCHAGGIPQVRMISGWP